MNVSLFHGAHSRCKKMAQVNKLHRFQQIMWQRWHIFMIFILWQIKLVNRDIWINPLNNLRGDKREFYSLYPNLCHYKRFFKFYRLSVERFDQLLDLIGPQITKKYTNFRTPISPEERLALTLR